MANGKGKGKGKTAQQKKIGAFGKSLKSAAKGYKKGKGVKGPKGKMLYGAAAAAYKRKHKSPRTRKSR
jgi:hypothetical protein